MVDPTQLTYWCAIFAAGGIGLAIGSFLNALEYRVHAGLSIIHNSKRSAARSMCPHCKHKLSSRDLVPVVSYITLAGRCRYCKKPIHWQYPLVELVSAGIWAVSAAYFGISSSMFIVGFFGMVLLFIFIYDYKYQLILDSVVLPMIPLVFALSLFRGFTWQDVLLGMLVGAGVFGFQYLVSRGKWIGAGDIRLGALMGAMLGLRVTVLAIFLAYLFGACIAVILLVCKKAGLESRIAFGTFLTTATFFCLFLGQHVVSWYLHLLV